jgi:hypothetical protein
VKISPKNTRLVISDLCRRGDLVLTVWYWAKRALVTFLLAAALSSAAYATEKHGATKTLPAEEVAASSPSVDACGHPIVKDGVGNPYKDPVCAALSDNVQPPLYRPDPECDRGGVSYDTRCFFQRLLTVMTASPGPAPLDAPE